MPCAAGRSQHRRYGAECDGNPPGPLRILGRTPAAAVHAAGTRRGTAALPASQRCYANDCTARNRSSHTARPLSLCCWDCRRRRDSRRSPGPGPADEFPHSLAVQIAAGTQELVSGLSRFNGYVALPSSPTTPVPVRRIGWRTGARPRSGHTRLVKSGNRRAGSARRCCIRRLAPSTYRTVCGNATSTWPRRASPAPAGIAKTPVRDRKTGRLLISYQYLRSVRSCVRAGAPTIPCGQEQSRTSARRVWPARLWFLTRGSTRQAVRHGTVPLPVPGGGAGRVPAPRRRRVSAQGGGGEDDEGPASVAVTRRGAGRRASAGLGGAARDDDVFRAGRLPAVASDRFEGERARE